MLAFKGGWSQTHPTHDSLHQGQAQEDSLPKPTQLQTIGIETILGPGWAGREPTQPVTRKTEPAHSITPRQYANSLALSLGASLVPVALGTVMLKQEVAEGWGLGLFMAGALVGPSTGQFVYGFAAHGLLATTIRVGASAAAISVLFGSYGSCGSSMFSDKDEPCSEGYDPTLGFIATGTAYFGSYLYSLIQPAFSIHHEPARTYLPAEVLPRLSYDAQGQSTLGMVAAWKF